MKGSKLSTSNLARNMARSKGCNTTSCAMATDELSDSLLTCGWT